MKRLMLLLRRVWFHGLDAGWDRTKAGDKLLQKMEDVLIDHNTPGV